MNQHQDQKKPQPNSSLRTQPAEQSVRGPLNGSRGQNTPFVASSPEEWLTIKKRWEGRIGHPRKLIGSTRAALEDLGYVVIGSYNDETAPMRDTSYFEGTIVARLDQQKTNHWLLALGLITLPLIVGYWIIKAAPELKRSLIKISFEGESYSVGAREGRVFQGNAHGRSAYAEKTGVVSDIRVNLKAGVGAAKGEDELKDGVYSPKSQLYAMTNGAADQLSTLWKDLARAK